MANPLLSLMKKGSKGDSGASALDESAGLGDTTEETPEGDAGPMAAEDFSKASKAGDGAAMFEAFERMYDACQAAKDKPGTDEGY